MVLSPDAIATTTALEGLSSGAFLRWGTRWLNTGELTVGATVRDAAGEVGVIEALVVVDAPQTMYNLTIARVATYVVGSAQWVVHNQRIGVEVFGGNRSLVDALAFGGRVYNVDLSLDITEGVRADALSLPFRSSSVNSVFITNPWVQSIRDQGNSQVRAFMIDTYTEAGRILVPDGQLIITGDKSANPFVRVGAPDIQEALKNLGFEVQVQPNNSPYGPLHPVFSQQDFHRSDGTQINPNRLMSVVCNL